MTKVMRVVWLAAGIGTLGVSASVAQQQAGAPAAKERPDAIAGRSLAADILVAPADVTWKPGPPSLPKGIQAAVLEGDPQRPERLFTMRLRLPAGTRIAPHHHGTDEHLTVLSGELGFGMGETFDQKRLRRYPPGSYIAMPAGHRHFVAVAQDTVLQLHGAGPWTITYVNPADDPRRGVGGSGTDRR